MEKIITIMERTVNITKKEEKSYFAIFFRIFTLYLGPSYQRKVFDMLKHHTKFYQYPCFCAFILQSN